MTREPRVRVRLTGLGAEKLFNQARRQGIRLYQVRREKDRALTVVCSLRNAPQFQALAREKGFDVGPIQPQGGLRVATQLVRRWGLGVGLVVCMAALAYLMSFVWEVRIENAGPYGGEVRAYLEELDVRPGIRRREIDLNALREKLEWRLPQVKWVRTGYAGVALVISLEEGTPPPQAQGAGKPGDVVASADGILIRLTTYAGTPVAKAGDVVRAGQVLIRGRERGGGGELVPVKARGEALARVWVSAKAAIPMEEIVTRPTGQETPRRVLCCPLGAWPIGDTPPYLTWDERITEESLGGAWLPLWLRRETYLEASLEKAQRPQEEVKREAGAGAVSLLARLTVGEQPIHTFLTFASQQTGMLEATATAELRRDIGRFKAE